MRTIIYKYANSDFENETCEWFKQIGCEVIAFEEIDSGMTGLRKRIKYIQTIIFKMNRECERIIVFDNYSFYILLMLFQRKKQNVYLWMWNKISTSRVEHIRLMISKLLGIVYSFDKNDCEKYGLRHNSQFYYCKKRETKYIKYNSFFVGKDKGRYNLLEKLSNYFDDCNISYTINIFPDNDKQYNKKQLISSSFMSYQEVCDTISKSEIILDIVQDGQEGLTLRAMEAIFYDKKIVTNNINYRNYDFYDSEKVYIIQNEEFDGLDEFLKNNKNVGYGQDVKNCCSIETWLTRFSV